MPETKMLIWVALLAMAAGTARRTRAFMSGVSRGRTNRTRAPALRAAQMTMAAWPTPATPTPTEAA